MKKMRKANVITALALTVVMLAAMTGIAAAIDEQIEILPDGSSGCPQSLTNLASPLIISNDNSANNIDVAFWDYLDSIQGTSHTLIVTVSTSSPGAAASDLTLTLTERGAGGASVSGTSPQTLAWTQNAGTGAAGCEAWDYIDLTIQSLGPDNAQYTLNFDDTGIGADFVVENFRVINVPEFATIAIPVAGILGLVLFFNHRKRKRE